MELEHAVAKGQYMQLAISTFSCCDESTCLDCLVILLLQWDNYLRVIAIHVCNHWPTLKEATLKQITCLSLIHI